MSEQYQYYPGDEVRSFVPSVYQETESIGQYENHAKGFYIDQFANESNQSQDDVHSPGAMSSLSSQNFMFMPNASATAAMYQQAAYATARGERGPGMPPTPPGSPDDPKNIALGMMNPQHFLAKPVPMRRLSEKGLAHARATLAVPGLQQDAIESLGQMGTTPAIAHAISVAQAAPKRPRTEKKPVPDEGKDDKYFERRKRNNNAAKKSRDARKMREDEIAIRASFLEKENAILRAQVATLREEANSLRQLLITKRSRGSCSDDAHGMGPQMGMKC